MVMCNNCADYSHLVIKRMKNWIFKTPIVITTEDDATYDSVVALLIERGLIKGAADAFELQEVGIENGQLDSYQ